MAPILSTMKKILDVDPMTGVTQYFHYDEISGDWGIESIQNVDPFIERNKRLQNDEEYKKRGMKNEFWHFASIPIMIQEKWLREDGIDLMNKDHWPKVKKKLMDPDYRYLRTTTGKI